MNIAIVSGANGLIGSESVAFFADKMDMVIGIDNDQRAYFFGPAASTRWNKEVLDAAPPPAMKVQPLTWSK